MPEWKSVALDGDEPADSPGDEDAHKTRTRSAPKPLPPRAAAERSRTIPVRKAH